MKVITIKNICIKISIIFSLFIIISIFFTYLTTSFSAKNKELELSNEVSKEKTQEEILLQKYKQKRLVALTFDDGPTKYTTNLVDELKKREVNVTFFVLGENIVKRKDVLKFASDMGNEIGIHSYVHKLFTNLNDVEILEQIDKTKKLIVNITKKEPKLIRVPYGAINKKVENIISKEGLTNVKWSVDSKDWQLKNIQKDYNYILKYFKGNDIILMHDIRETSIEAALEIIDKLQSDGYTFVTVSTFLKIQNLDLDI